MISNCNFLVRLLLVKDWVQAASNLFGKHAVCTTNMLQRKEKRSRKPAKVWSFTAGEPAPKKQKVDGDVKEKNILYGKGAYLALLTDKGKLS